MKNKFFPRRIVDAHQHAFWNGRDDRGLVADLDEHGIAYAWLLTWEIFPEEDNPAYHRTLNPLGLRADGTHEGITLRDLVRAKEHYPDRFVLGYCPHPAWGDAPGLLRAAAQIHGVQICGEWKFRLPLDDPRCLELFRTAGELKMPVTFHLDVPYLPDVSGKRTYRSKWYGGTGENLELVLQACPTTVFIGHAPGFWREISGDANTAPQMYPEGPVREGGRLSQLLDTYPNLHADLSADSALRALRRDAQNARLFLTRYHDRLLFARDCYGPDLHHFLQTLSLPPVVAANIYYRNAERLVPQPAGYRT